MQQDHAFGESAGKREVNVGRVEYSSRGRDDEHEEEAQLTAVLEQSIGKREADQKFIGNTSSESHCQRAELTDQRTQIDTA